MVSDASIKSFVKESIFLTVYGKDLIISDIEIINIHRIPGFEIISVDYKVSLNEKRHWVEGTITLDMANPQTKRDLILKDLI